MTHIELQLTGRPVSMRAALAIVTVIAFAGCGGGDRPSTTTGAQRHPAGVRTAHASAGGVSIALVAEASHAALAAADKLVEAASESGAVPGEIPAPSSVPGAVPALPPGVRDELRAFERALPTGVP